MTVFWLLQRSHGRQFDFEGELCQILGPHPKCPAQWEVSFQPVNLTVAADTAEHAPPTNHLSSGTSAPSQPPGDLKVLDKICNEATWLQAAYQDWMQGALQFWDEKITARMELSLFCQTLAPSAFRHM